MSHRLGGWQGSKREAKEAMSLCALVVLLDFNTRSRLSVRADS